MSKLSKNTIIFGAIVLLFVLGAVAVMLSHKPIEVPEGTLGNTAGNLNNNGLYCESDGVVYFANPYDNNALYSMSPDGSDLKRIIDLDVKFINAGGNYVFFYGKPHMTTTGLGSVVGKPGMYCIQKDGKKLVALTKDVSQNMILYGNKIYYQHYTIKDGTTFNVMDLKTKEPKELLHYMINPSSMYNGTIFYNGMYKDHYLYAFNTVDNTESVIWEGDIWNPIYDNGYVYYMDVLNDYRLCRYSIGNNTIEILTNERTDFFNLYGNYIYYQVSSPVSPALKRISLDGSEQITLADGIYKDINVTSTYVYFTAFGTDSPIYRTPTYGAPNVTEFTAPRDAALKYMKDK